MENQKISLLKFDPDDVIALDTYSDERGRVKEERLIRISQLISKLNVILQNRLPQFFNGALIDFGLRSPSIHDWFQEGIDCAVLKIGSQKWCKGKLKISIVIEFIPDATDVNLQDKQPVGKQAESPLDEIRQMMTDGHIATDHE